jgi:pimeloyl-ACP methyl ester carboxylesterase
MTPRRFLPRALFLTTVLTLFSVGGFLAWFQSWRTGEMLDLASCSEVVKLPSGEMEFAARGDGVPVLIFHSAPGGYDQALALGGFLENAGFQIIAPSRPGYLRTPLSTGPTPEAEAKAAVELLDQLDISKTAVIGFGWGGAAAIEFAKRFADRTSAVILVSAPSLEIPPAPGKQLPTSIAEKIGGNVSSWLFERKVERNPAQVLAEAFDLTSSGDAATRSAWGDFILQNPDELERFQETFLSLAPLAPRQEGLENDLLQPPVSIRGVTPPVLLVHGALDKAVPPPTDPSRFSPAELFLVPGEGHLVLSGRGVSSAAKRIMDFLNLHPSSHGP